MGIFQAIKSAAEPATSLLRTVNSDNSDDYVIWFMIGADIMVLASTVLQWPMSITFTSSLE